MNGTVLVTGAAGFLGSHLCEKYLRDNLFVVGVDNFCTGQKKNIDYLKSLPELGDRFHFVEADVCRPWREWCDPLPDFVIKQLKYVLHFASPASPPHYQRLAKETMWVNSIGTQEALELADRHGARLVFASTSEIYGDPEVSPQPESYWGNVNSAGPRACYDEAKRFGEALIYTHNQKNQTSHGFVRIFNTYGPRMNLADGRVIIQFLVQANKREALTLYGDGSQTRSFCYVDDLVEGIQRYAGSGATDAVNLGNENEFTILQLADAVQKLFSDRVLTKKFEALPKDDPRKRRPDLTRARQMLNGWEPRVQLAEGLKKMYQNLEVPE